MTVQNLPQPPRFSGNADTDAIHLREYMWGLYNATVARFEEIEANMAAIAAVTPLADATTATAEQNATAINAIIAAAAEAD